MYHEARKKKIQIPPPESQICEAVGQGASALEWAKDQNGVQRRAARQRRTNQMSAGENMRDEYTPVEFVDTTNLPEEEWLAWRRKGIGGSDAAAIMGISPFRTARDIY